MLSLASGKPMHLAISSIVASSRSGSSTTKPETFSFQIRTFCQLLNGLDAMCRSTGWSCGSGIKGGALRPCRRPPPRSQQATLLRTCRRARCCTTSSPRPPHRPSLAHPPNLCAPACCSLPCLARSASLRIVLPMQLRGLVVDIVSNG